MWQPPGVDRSTHITLGGFLAGAVVGYGFGWLVAVVNRAWKDASIARIGAGAVGRAAWRRTLEFAVLGFGLLVVAALVLGGITER
jgi:hypothetical protein